MNFFKPTIEQANIVKKDWLISFIIQFIANAAVSIIMSKQPGLSHLPLSVPAWTFPLIGIAIGSCFSYLIYYCAYKKNGTKWLLLILIAAPLGLALSIFQYIPVLGIANTLVVAFIQLYYFIYTFRLYNINKQLQQQEKTVS